jgi:tripartite-type tricarboxylate transporter receptor subunit TctC
MKKQLVDKFLLAVVAVVMCLWFITPVMASEKYPEKPVQLIVPYKAGGGTDAIMRLISQYASKYLGESMVVVNVPGVGGTMGLRRGADAKPDGYTVVALHEAVVTTKITGVTNYDFQKVIPIATMTITPIVMAARSDAPWKNFAELITYAKTNPKTVKVGVTLGSTPHFTLLNISAQTGAKFKIVGYDGTAERQAALAGGFIDLGETSIAAGNSYFKAGKLKAYAIASAKRHPNLPDVPTLKEQGIDVIFEYNRGLYAPLGTPASIVDKLEGVLKKVAADKEFIASIERLGSDVAFKNSETTRVYVDGLMNRYTKLYEQLSKASN